MCGKAKTEVKSSEVSSKEYVSPNVKAFTYASGAVDVYLSASQAKAICSLIGAHTAGLARTKEGKDLLAIFDGLQGVSVPVERLNLVPRNHFDNDAVLMFPL